MNENQCLPHLDLSVMSWLLNAFLKLFKNWLNSVQKHQENFERDADQKMLISWGGKHMKD